MVCQGEIVAESLKDYLGRHPEMEIRCRRGGTCEYLTTENPEKFTGLGRVFLNEDVIATHVDID